MINRHEIGIFDACLTIYTYDVLEIFSTYSIRTKNSRIENVSDGFSVSYD